MTRSAVQQLAGIGKKLAHPPHTKDDILKQLKLAAEMLSEMKQSHGVAAAIEPLTRALILPMLTRHKDKDVRLLTSTCIMEIMRIVAPVAPYSDEELQEIFRLVVFAFEGLDEISSSSFGRRTIILEIMANLRICVVMLDVGCDDLILEMFHTFFSVISDKHLSSVYTAMQTIMAAVLQESENIALPLLDVILNNLLKHKGVSAAAHKLAIGIVQQCAEKLEPYVQRLLTSVMVEGKAAEIDLHADYHDIIHEIYQWAPQMLLAVIPNLTQELVNDKVNVRLKAVCLLGRLFALPGQHVAKEYRQLFSEFLKRFTDKAVEVRLAMIDCANNCLKANPFGSEATEILGGLDDRILDNEEIVRLHVVVAICEVAKENLKWMPVSLISHVAERLRDKKVLVRKETFQRLAELYRVYCIKCFEGSATGDTQLEWIPSKLVRCCYDKDVKEFRPAALEILFSENLFPRQISVEDRARHWIAVYAAFEEIDKKALARVLSQKKRLQEDMSEYLCLRQKGKEMNMDDTHVQNLFRAMSLLFGDDNKVEENFQKLHKMKDKKIFKALSQLLDPSTSFIQSEEINEDLLKRIGESHPQHEFVKVLSLRCSLRIFGKEHAKAVLEQVISNRDSDNKDKGTAGLSLLSVFAGFFPFLIQDVKADLLCLLLNGDDIIKEKVADILAKAGSSIRGQIKEGSTVELTLQQLCLEGSRKQAKCAVSALVVVNADAGFKALSILYGCLMERLHENNAHLPTVLQSLSCIAQNAINVFESQEDNIVRFVVRTLLLQRSSVTERGHTEEQDWESLSSTCQLKKYGLKTLVKSFLPVKDHPRKRLRGLLGLLWKLLPNGEISENSGSSEIEKAHLRLASAIGVLRLARRLDSQIPPSLFHSCLLTGQDQCIEVRRQFLKKLHQYLKDHTLSHKYASAYALFASDSSKGVLADAKHYLADFIEGCRREARLLQNSTDGQIDAYPITYNPEYVLTYLVHILAYHPSFPDSESKTVDAYEPFYRILLFYLRSLVHQDNEGLGKRDAADNLPAILAIFRTMKKAEDALEGKKTKSVHIICDLGIVITKELGRSRLLSETYPGLIPLPSLFYKLRDGDEDDSCQVDGNELPPCLNDTNALAQFWSRGSRFGQVHSLGSNQHPVKGKRDAEEGLSSDQREGDDAGELVEQDKSPESMQATAEFQKSSKTVRIVDKTTVKVKAMDSSSRDQKDSGATAALDSKLENESVDGVNGVSTLCTRNRRYNKIIGTPIENDQEEHVFTSENGGKSTRAARNQAVGLRIVMGSRNGKAILSTSKSERGKNTQRSKFHCRSVAKRLEMDAEFDPIKSEPIGKLDLNQKTLPEIFNSRKRSLRQRDAGNSFEADRRKSIGEEDKRPQTRSRKAAACHNAEVLSQLQSNLESTVRRKRKTLAADAGNVLIKNGQIHGDSRSIEAPAEQELKARERSNEPTHGGRILRKRNTPQKASPKVTERSFTSNDESDQEPAATWRSRRRKVQ